MKLIWRRGRKSEIRLLSNSLTFARSPVGCRTLVSLLNAQYRYLGKQCVPACVSAAQHSNVMNYLDLKIPSNLQSMDGRYTQHSD